MFKELYLPDGRKAIEAVLELAKEGKTRGQLSEELGITIEQICYFRDKLIKKGLLEEPSKEQKEQENLERRLNVSRSMGGVLADIRFYVQMGLSPLQIVDACRLETGVSLDLPSVDRTQKHLKRKGEVLYQSADYLTQAMRYRLLPIEERQALVKPWVDLKPNGAKRAILFKSFFDDGNLGFDDVLGFSQEAEGLMEVSGASLPEPPLTLTERLAIGSYWYAKTQHKGGNKSPMSSFFSIHEAFSQSEHDRVQPIIDLIRERIVKEDNSNNQDPADKYDVRRFARVEGFMKHFGVNPYE